MAKPGVARKKEPQTMPDPITIIRSDETSHGAYRAEVPGSTKLAELTWRADGNVRVADHTFVPPEARGTGIAAQLVEALVADAREQGFTVVPQCSYVAVAFRRHPEWADLLAKE
ncbi:GNAT family N-acetyltransferase [Croceibacterium xixiisoli]